QRSTTLRCSARPVGVRLDPRRPVGGRLGRAGGPVGCWIDFAGRPIGCRLGFRGRPVGGEPGARYGGGEGEGGGTQHDPDALRRRLFGVPHDVPLGLTLRCTGGTTLTLQNLTNVVSFEILESASRSSPERAPGRSPVPGRAG